MSLAWKLVGATLTLLAVALGSYGVRALDAQRTAFLGELDLRGSLVARSAAAGSVEAFLVRDYPVLETIAQGVLDGSDDVVLVRILDSRGACLIEKGDPSPARGLRTYRGKIEIPGSHSSLGSLEVRLSDARTRASLGLQSQLAIWTVLATFFSVALLLVFLVGRLIGAPLSQLDQEVYRIGEGCLEEPVEFSGGGELGRFAQTLETMRERLNRSQKGLVEALEVAQRAERARAEFVMNISHELKTPLHGLLAAVEFLEGAELTGECVEWVATVGSASSHLDRLVTDILDWTALEEGTLALEQDDVDLVALVEGVLSDHRPIAEGQGQTLEFDGSPGLAMVRRGDRRRVRKILEHLVDNAVKFGGTGRIRVGLAENGSGVRLTVQDEGPGFDEASLKTAFDPFHQRDGSTTRCRGGQGLGLALVRGLAEAMQGDVRIQNEEDGQGVTVAVCLALPVMGESGREGVGSLTVLVVDDSPINRRVAARILERADHEVLEACDGVEALEIFERERLDLVLMDCQMPRMDGFEATRAIRALEAQRGGRRTPILALTAGAFEGGTERCLQAGMDGYLSKPVDAACLVDHVARVVGAQT